MLLRTDGTEVGASAASLDVETVMCQRCEGEGEFEDFMDGPARPDGLGGYSDVWYGLMTCPDCDGEGVVAL